MRRGTHALGLLLPALACAGCLSLTPAERQALESAERAGYSLEFPPTDFNPPVDGTTAAGLNGLPGIGNFYLATRGGGGIQWLLGAGNLLLWPFSPIWSVYEGYADAETLNRRALAKFWEAHPGLPRKNLVPAAPEITARKHPAEERPAEKRTTAESGRESGRRTAPAPVKPPKPERPPFDIVSTEPYKDGRAVYRVSILDPSKTAFEIERLVRPDIERIVRDAFASGNPDIPPESIRVSVVPDFGSDRTILFTAVAFSAELASDGWTYSSETRRGTVQLHVGGRVDARTARLWARHNIASIVRDKNAALSPDEETPPLGAAFQSLSESLDKGILTIEFAVVD